MPSAKVQILPLRRATPPHHIRPAANASTCSEAGNATRYDTLDTVTSEHNSSSTTAEDQTSATKQPRTSKPKVRSGCLTCKIRRVKCDELKPSCDRCTSTGRKCDGYNITPRKPRSDRNRARQPKVLNVGDPSRSLTVMSGSQDELRSLEYFHFRAAPGLSSYFDTAFWSELVFQMSHAEPAIRHAMIAVAYLHRQRERIGTRPLALRKEGVARGPDLILGEAHDHNDLFVLSQYNKAIFHLSKRMHDESAIEVALLACILFVSIDFLRGDTTSATNHFNSGMSIALSSLRQFGDNNAALTMVRIRHNVLPFFNRLELLGMLFGQSASPSYSTDLTEAVPQHFTSVKEARDSIVHLMNLSLQYVRSVKPRRYERSITPRDLIRKAGLEAALQAWRRAFTTFSTTRTMSPNLLDATKILQIHETLVKIWLYTSIFAAETATDHKLREFETAVTLAESIQTTTTTTTSTRHQGTSSHSHSHSTTFLFDMELVSPLYFISIKCRHPYLRRRALALLRHTNRREGLWDSEVAAAIAERVMRIEERNLMGLDGSPQVPCESDRVHNTLIEGLTKGIALGAGPYAVTFCSKPGGLEGAWKVWGEEIGLDGSGVERAPGDVGWAVLVGTTSA